MFLFFNFCLLIFIQSDSLIAIKMYFPRETWGTRNIQKNTISKTEKNNNYTIDKELKTRIIKKTSDNNALKSEKEKSA